MPLSRLLAIALVVFPFAAFGQGKQNVATPANQQVASAAVPAEPWRILPGDASKRVAPKATVQLEPQPSPTPSKSQDPGIIFENVPKTAANNNLIVLSPNDLIASPGGMVLDTYCLKIRSYVVARDSKGSDSTHLVHYSTCQPASRYRLKTVELQSQPASR